MTSVLSQADANIQLRSAELKHEFPSQIYITKSHGC